MYTDNLTKYSRRETIEVKIGNTPMGAHHPIRIQSMTTVDTMDTERSIEQCIRMIESGCEYIRITAPSKKEAENLANIKQGLRDRGYDTPLVADIHFTPNAAEVAAKIVEKVRINPGNYADKKRFDVIDYTDESYQEELDRIRERFAPLVEICKQHGTAMRIGTNHGSLSDRITSRYGDTPEGMVESAIEFIKFCEDLDFYNLVVSMKSSNPQVMVQAYRLLVKRLKEENLKPYPLHLGVTEAGEGEDGRIKSALGIGTLLEDGLGDTVRVSLTEEPEFEAPVARKLIDRYSDREKHLDISNITEDLPYSPYEYKKRTSLEVYNFGGGNVPRVIADFSKEANLNKDHLKQIGHFYLPETDKWSSNDTAADYIYCGNNAPKFELPFGIKGIVDSNALPADNVQQFIPLYTKDNFSDYHQGFAFLSISTVELTSDLASTLKNKNELVLILHSNNIHHMADLRRAYLCLHEHGIELPIVLKSTEKGSEEDIQIHAPSNIGGLFIDGIGEGIMLSAVNRESKAMLNSVSFGILQAARCRITKTEYISCPSCGRTLFDLQETTAMIRNRTDHLKGLKIGIMGCIVNGPGEMADADYGYVGSGPGKITLYRGQEVVKKGINFESALDELIGLIKGDGKWIEPESISA